MMQFLYFLVLTLLSVPCCLSASIYKNIFYNGLAVTLDTSVKPFGLILAPLRVNDPNQQWLMDSEGFIISRGQVTEDCPPVDLGDGITYVIDVLDQKLQEGSPVSVWPKKPPNTPNPNNQKFKWTGTDGKIMSLSGDGYGLKPVFDGENSGHLVASFCPDPATIKDALGDLICTSCGDPHIRPFYPFYLDLYSPGVQYSGEYVLARYGAARVVQRQRPCGAGRAFCNFNTSVEYGKDQVLINHDNVKINRVVTPIEGTKQINKHLSITKLSKLNYHVQAGGGNINVAIAAGGGYGNYQCITINITCGPPPDGGLCQPVPGPGPDDDGSDSGSDAFAITRAPPKKSSQKLTVAQFTKSWRVRNVCDDPFETSTQAFHDGNPNDFPPYNYQPAGDATLRAKAAELCSPLKTGKIVDQCAAYVNPTTYYDACIFDITEAGEFTFASHIIDPYERDCAAIAPPPLVFPPSAITTTATGPGLAHEVPQDATHATTFTINAIDILGHHLHTGGDPFIITSKPTLSFNQVDNGDGTYTVSYTPATLVAYEISIKYKGIDEIADSPFHVNVVSTATNAPQSIAYGPGVADQITAGKQVSFTIQARTASGADRTTGGDKWTVKVPNTPSGFQAPIQDFKNGHYVVYYEQPKVGKFDLTVQLNGVNIKGSPFHINAVAAKKDEL